MLLLCLELLDTTGLVAGLAGCCLAGGALAGTEAAFPEMRGADVLPATFLSLLPDSQKPPMVEKKIS